MGTRNKIEIVHSSKLTRELTGIGIPNKTDIKGAKSFWLISTRSKWFKFQLNGLCELWTIFGLSIPDPQITYGTSVSLSDASPWDPTKDSYGKNSRIFHENTNRKLPQSDIPWSEVNRNTVWSSL